MRAEGCPNTSGLRFNPYARVTKGGSRIPTFRSRSVTVSVVVCRDERTVRLELARGGMGDCMDSGGGGHLGWGGASTVVGHQFSRIRSLSFLDLAAGPRERDRRNDLPAIALRHMGSVYPFVAFSVEQDAYWANHLVSDQHCRDDLFYNYFKSRLIRLSVSKKTGGYGVEWVTPSPWMLPRMKGATTIDYLGRIRGLYNGEVHRVAEWRNGLSGRLS
ncbi:hypothetical protein BDM02DRAFT_3127270 [Thelephora ganbajun]|uniref:Uncharacterized protein n=1 Tax=Thelephora ganbajun TaxID=370292 RepID=A0ACB6ZN15_THEGA|nr:hypothetical protein BDM02DRAFT_3127270 [Thelephora ganbajun]